MVTDRDGSASSSVLPPCLIRRSGGRIGGTTHRLLESWTFTSRCVEETIVRYLLLLPNSLIQIGTEQGRLRGTHHWLWAAFGKVADLYNHRYDRVEPADAHVEDWQTFIFIHIHREPEPFLHLLN